MFKLVDAALSDYAHEVLTKRDVKITRAEFDELVARTSRGDKEAAEKIMIAVEGWSESNGVIDIAWLGELPREWVIANLHTNIDAFVAYMRIVHGVTLPGQGGMPNASTAAEIPRWFLHAIRAAGAVARDMIPYRMRIWYGVKFVSAYLMANYLEHTNTPGRAEYDAITNDPLLRDFLPWAGIDIELHNNDKLRIVIATDVLRCLAMYKDTRF